MAPGWPSTSGISLIHAVNGHRYFKLRTPERLQAPHCPMLLWVGTRLAAQFQQMSTLVSLQWLSVCANSNLGAATNISKLAACTALTALDLQNMSVISFAPLAACVNLRYLQAVGTMTVELRNRLWPLLTFGPGITFV